MARNYILLTVAVLWLGVALAIGVGCLPQNDGFQKVILKALSSDGCEGCNGPELEEGEGEDEGEGEITVEGEAQSVLSVSPVTQDIDWLGGLFTLSIRTSAVWTAHADGAWITLDKLYGTGDSVLTVYCLGNSGTTRSATITVIGVDTDPPLVSVEVNQAAMPVVEEGEAPEEGELNEGEETPEGETIEEGESVPEGEGESTVFSGEMVDVAAGRFTMGRTSSGDDDIYGLISEDPQHQVTLSPYHLGKYEVTNKEYCEVLNWALKQGYLYSDTDGAPWSGTGDIYAGDAADARYLIVSFSSGDCNIRYGSKRFFPKSRTALQPFPVGLAEYSMDNHPVVCVSWYGAAAFCDWLSRMEGLTPCYDMSAPSWPLTIAPPKSGGYRLPTEAEWERAAAWDGDHHWAYGFMSDTNSGPGSNNRCNDFWHDGEDYAYVNPLGLLLPPLTSPVGWFNGENVSPNSNIQTVDSPSPVGAYDMSGNVWEWCHDWFSVYTPIGQNDPTGPADGVGRVVRGGCWLCTFYYCRTSLRPNNDPEDTSGTIGFRVARS